MICLMINICGIITKSLGRLVTFADIPGCELAQALSENRYDYQAFINAIPKIVY